MDESKTTIIKAKRGKNGKIDITKILGDPLFAIPCCTGCFSVIFVVTLFLALVAFYLLTSY